MTEKPESAKRYERYAAYAGIVTLAVVARIILGHLVGSNFWRTVLGTLIWAVAAFCVMRYLFISGKVEQ